MIPPTPPVPAPWPALDDLLDGLRVVVLPMRVRFRGVTSREVALVEGPAGWGEFAPFREYDDAESAAWLASAVEMAWAGPPPRLRDRVPVNATVPAVAPGDVAGILDRFPGCRTVKVKVAERGQTLADDLARVRAAARARPGALVRVDANQAWGHDEALAAIPRLADAVAGEDGTFDYAEQPVPGIDGLIALRAGLAQRCRGRAGGVPRVAADEAIRRAGDPFVVARRRAADAAVVKAAPLGGPRRLLAVAAALADAGIPVTVSSALDSAVGMAAGLAAAAALPGAGAAGGGAIPACGLGTGSLLAEDVCAPRELVDGALDAGPVAPDAARLDALAAPPEVRRWWIDRVRRCHALVGE